MPIYRITAPNGKSYQIEGPPGASDAEVAQAVLGQNPEAGQAPPETTMMGGAKELFKGIVPGAVGLLESAATGASALLPEDMEKSAREKIKSVATAAKEPFAAAPGYEETIPRKLGEAIGSTAPFLLAGPFGLAGRAAAVGLGVGAGAGESRTRAEEAGATGEQRGTATALGMIPGALEAFAPLRILSRIPTASTAAGVEIVKRALIAGGEEAAQEAASGFAQNLIAKGIYKPEQALIEGLGEQAAYGGATGAIVQGLMDMALGRRARGAKTTPTEEKPALPAEPGTQGALFEPGEAPVPRQPELDMFGEPVTRALEAPTAVPGVPEGQQDLGLDYQREYADMVQERERLKQMEPTPEIKARVAELGEQMALYTQGDIESIRAQRESQAMAAAEDAKARKKFPGLAGAPELMTMPDEVKARTQGEMFPGEDLGMPPAPGAPITEPTLRGAKEKAPLQYKLPLRSVREGREPQRGFPMPEQAAPLTMQDVLDVNIPLRKGMQPWFEQNIVGKTLSEVQALVKRTPALIEGPSQQAKILRELLAPQPAPFKEAPRVEPTITETPAVEQRIEPGAGEPSMGVPSEPTPAERVQPGAGVPPTAEAPVTPDGLGLVPTGRPAVPGVAPQGAEPAAVTSRDLQTQIRTLADQQLELLDSAGRMPRVNTKKAQQWEDFQTQIDRLRRQWDVVDRRERATPPAAVAETPAEEAARQTEAEAVRRQMEALEKRPAKPAAPAPAPKAEKAAPTEIPSKMYEPVGASEVGMEEGQKEILRGPQAMLFPMSKREELEYAERARPETEAAAGPTKPQMVPRDSRQGRLDFTKAPEAPQAVQDAAKKLKGTVAFYDGDVALIRASEGNTGESIYIPVSNKTDFFTKGLGGGALDIGSIRGDVSKLFTKDQFDTLKAATDQLKSEDRAKAAKAPDGPFTGATSNVVAGASIDPRYTNYLTDLMKSMGLGDVRVFLYHGKDVQGKLDALNLHGTYFPILARAEPDPGQKGATKAIGPDGKDFMLFINDNMSDAQALEVIAHELGHMIQQIAYDGAPANVKDAVIDEYDAWLASMKGKKLSDLVPSLRNRNTAEAMEADGVTDVELSKLSADSKRYWLGFGEWFADNVSRWATTADKPLTITEKFFSKVGQMMRDLVATVTGRKFPPAKSVREFMDAMGPGSADAWMAKSHPTGKGVQPLQNAVSFSTEQLVESMGPLETAPENGLRKLISSFKAGTSPAEPGYAVKFRTQVADAAATIEHRLREQFDGKVRDSLGKLNPMGLYRQAQDHAKLLLEYFQQGSLVKDPSTGLWKVATQTNVQPPAAVYALIDNWAAKNGYSRERGTQIASRVLEGVRLDSMRTANKTEGAEFLLHLKDNEIDQLVREYKADPDLQAMSKAMDEARKAMVDNMVAVGRLSKETGELWKDTVGYVPFDRLEDKDFAEKFSKVKKISNKGLAQIGKLPELKGSLNRPVGNVFDNYINTLGWMVGQTMKTDGTVHTLRSLEDVGHAKFLGRNALGKANTVAAYVKGEKMYWEVPSKYDVMAFNDLNPPKAGWLRALGQFSDVLRKSVTVLPPFALKQVTDDVQRAIMTSGVKNPGALLRMSLTNFPKLALAELRGIQHPMVREFGAMGLTGEYDFQQGKPAISLLKDLKYKPRGKFETLIHRLDGITRASDLAVRKAIYDQTMKESGKDELLAQTRAREFINFRRRGASDFIGAMVTTIPFFNAYIQGMDVLYRAASGKDSSSSIGRAQARRMFWSRAAIVTMLSSLYAMGAGDDEEYKDMDLRTRDGNWILPGIGKIPVPGELGALFKVIPERIVEYMKRQGTPEEQTAWEATRTALTYMFEQYIGRATPVPQAVKPLMEAWANKSFLTGRELEGIYQKQQDPSMRRSAQTSELAIAIANFSRDSVGVEVSPIQIDNALRGYFGSTAALLTATTDSLLNPTRVDRPLHKWALLSTYMYDPVGTRRMTEFYEEREKVGRANTTLNELMKTDMDRAAAYAEEHADELMLESAVNSTLNQLENTRAYRKYLNSPDGAKAMPASEREAALKEVKQMELGMVGWLREAKVAIRQ